MAQAENPREIAARLLARRRHGAHLEELFEREAAHLKPADRHLCQHLVYGCARWEATLDHLIAQKTQGRTQKPALQNLLRLGLYQIFWLERIPPHAAVFETVEQAKRAGFGPQAGFINALLRGYIREATATRQQLADLKSTKPHLGFSHPEWLVNRWRERWGAEDAAHLMAWNNEPPATFARVNRLKYEPGELLERWREENVEYDFVRRDWIGENEIFELKTHPALARLESFLTGAFYVQDPSTLLAVRELAPQPGEKVLDLCAAPGGKLTLIAQLMKNEGRLLAYELLPERRGLVSENCARLGVHCATVLESEAELAAAAGTCERVLVDAPCSNTGVMRRRVELRWRVTPEEIKRLAEVQLDLLRRAAGLLKRAGTLVYSTCSLEREENEEVVASFLRTHPRFKLEHGRLLLPFRDGVDGAFVARLRCKA